MNYPDFFMINEAWRKAEAFARAAQREHLLSVYRASRTGSRRRRAAQPLPKLAGRLGWQVPPGKPSSLSFVLHLDCCYFADHVVALST